MNHCCGNGQLCDSLFHLGAQEFVFTQPGPVSDINAALERRTTLREKLITVSTNVVPHSRCVTFQLAEVAIPRALFGQILRIIADPREPPPQLA
jgi:hypothetical protein